MNAPAKSKPRVSARARNAKLAIALLENGLRDGRIVAAQKAAIAVLRSPEPVAESVCLVRFRAPSAAALKKAGGLEEKARHLSGRE